MKLNQTYWVLKDARIKDEELIFSDSFREDRDDIMFWGIKYFKDFPGLLMSGEFKIVPVKIVEVKDE